MMKNLFLISGCIGLGFYLNSNSGKNLRKVAYTKAKSLVENLLEKLDKFTEASSKDECSCKEEESIA